MTNKRLSCLDCGTNLLVIPINVSQGTVTCSCGIAYAAELLIEADGNVGRWERIRTNRWFERNDDCLTVYTGPDGEAIAPPAKELATR